MPVEQITVTLTRNEWHRVVAMMESVFASKPDKEVSKKISGQIPPPADDRRGRVWVRRSVMSVECPDCAFTFDVDHTDNDSHLYTCPVCGNPDPDPELERLLDEAHAGFGIR